MFVEIWAIVCQLDWYLFCYSYFDEDLTNIISLTKATNIYFKVMVQSMLNMQLASTSECPSIRVDNTIEHTPDSRVNKGHGTPEHRELSYLILTYTVMLQHTLCLALLLCINHSQYRGTADLISHHAACAIFSSCCYSMAFDFQLFCVWLALCSLQSQAVYLVSSQQVDLY